MGDNDIIQSLISAGSCVFEFLSHQFNGEDEEYNEEER